MTKEIYETPLDYLITVDREKYVEYLVNKYSMAPVRFAFLDLSVEPGEAEIPVEQFPFKSEGSKGRRYRAPVYRYHLPYTGAQQLLSAIPDPNIPVEYDVDINPDSVSFVIVDFHNDPDRIKKEAYRIVGMIKRQSEHLRNNIEAYVGELWQKARYSFDLRRTELLQQQKVTNALGVPVRRRALAKNEKRKHEAASLWWFHQYNTQQG